MQKQKMGSKATTVIQQPPGLPLEGFARATLVASCRGRARRGTISEHVAVERMGMSMETLA
jgi:hypothetical protein